jgi:SAM-dependent methyltransferase
MVMLTSSQITQVTNLLNKTTLDDEFEVMFNNYKNDNKLSIIQFMDILKYLRYRSDVEKLELKHEVILDVIFDYEANNMYRVSIKGIKNINDFLNLVHQRSNHVLFSILLTQSEFLKNENFIYIRKQKDPNNIIDFDQYDIRIRKSSEKQLTDKDFQNLINMGINSSSKISFRYKNRLTLDLIDNTKHKLSIDLTTIQSNSNMNNIMSLPKGYEIEIDYSIKKEDSKGDISDTIIKEIEIIKKIIEGTDILITKEENQLIIDAYKRTIAINEIMNGSLYTMQPISAEVQHIVDKIPNFYSVTDKADGEKNQLFIFNKTIYLINNNLKVKKTKYKSELNNTILEGELIYIAEEKKYVFMAFDCLYYANKDIKEESILLKRLDYVNKVCKDINKDIYISKDFTGKFNLKDQEKFYKNEIKNFYDNLDKQIKKLKANEIFFHPKFFILPTGGSNSEVYMFADLIWDYYTKSNMNYKLDGIIFTGAEQKYTRDKREHKYPIYKYKPPETNSIDIYLNYQRNLETNTYLEIYDNSIGNQNNQVYRVANFFVGDLIGNKEVPILFMKEEQNHEAYFPLINGEVRDQDGNYVQDNTVIEVSYNNDSNIPHPYRWIILRTRWDKTEDVYKYQKRYGNFKDVAIKTWKSIKEAVTIDEIKNLSNEDTFLQQQKLLQNRLNSTVITTERQQDIYYQKITNLCKKMREYHNWIKSIIIYTYCSPLKENKDSQKHRTSVLDLGCGRGGDILKWYHARVGEYVGTDVDYYGIYSSTNGAISRYNEFKKKFPSFVKAYWVQADGSTLLESSYQENKLPNMTKENKLVIDKTFTKNKKFDCISSMFALHYLFDSEESTNNLVQNINNHLKIGGFLIFTLFDGNLIMEKLGDKDRFTTYYTDDDGTRKKLFEIVKKFDGKLKDKEGFPIDVYLAWFMEENKYATEYLVTPELLNKVMKKANCRLVESDTFSNLYNLNHQYFTDVIEHEENPKNYQFYKKVASFYEDLKGIDKESRVFTFLNRYYVYQKTK